MIPSRVLRAVLAALIALAVAAPLAVLAQDPSWSRPAVLTTQLETFSIRPLLASDPFGYLHAIWTEGERAVGAHARLDSIYYSVRSEGGWSEPVNIAAARVDAEMSEVKGFVATPNGYLVVAWAEMGQVWIARAPGDAATSARAWGRHLVDAGSNPTLVVSEGGQALYVAYWADQRTLVASRSDDDGSTWSVPMGVWQAPDGAAGLHLAGVVTQDGELHLVWSEPNERRGWNSEAIWHARITPELSNVSVRVVARSATPDEPTLDGPNIAACPDGSMHIVWNNGVGSPTGRFHQTWSPTDGKWTPVRPIFPGLSGQTHRPGLMCDNTGRVHLVSAADSAVTGDPRYGLRYATWYDGAWSPYETLWDGAYSGERPHMVIVGGNQLHLVWHVYDLEGQRVDLTAHSSRQIDALAVAPVEPRRPASDAPAEPTPTPVRIAEADPPPVSPPGGLAQQTVPAQSGGMEQGVSPFLLAVGAVLPLLGVAFWLARRRSR